VSTRRLIFKVMFGLGFMLAGLNHFRVPGFYLRMMPPYLPWHAALVYASGVAEVMLGALLLVPKTSIVAAWGLVVLLIAVFPANVHMALYPELFSEFPPALLWARLPLQIFLIAWALRYTRRPSH
jgi:uncharacterized membrane protein